MNAGGEKNWHLSTQANPSTESKEKSLSYLVIFTKLVPFLLGAAAAHRTHIDQAVPELYEGAALNWQRQGGHVPQSKVNERLQLLLSHVALDAL